MEARLSILDLAPIARGQTASDSFAASVALAQRAEELGYQRVWYAEHHNMPSIASSATSVLIAHVGAHTSIDQARLRRGHAAEPFPAGDRGAVRHPRGDVPGPHRPRARPGPRLRPEHYLRAAPRPAGVRGVPAGRPGAAGLPGRRQQGAGRGSRPRHRGEGPALHPGLVAVRRAAGRRLRAAVRVRLALRARRARARARRLPRPSSSRRRSSRRPTRSSGST